MWTFPYGMSSLKAKILSSIFHLTTFIPGAQAFFLLSKHFPYRRALAHNDPSARSTASPIPCPEIVQVSIKLFSSKKHFLIKYQSSLL